MKILIVSSSFFPKIDGSTRCVYDHARKLAERGNEVFLVTRGIPGAKRTETFEGIKVRRTSYAFRGGLLATRIRLLLEQAVIVLGLQRREHFQAIHAHGFASAIAAFPSKYLQGVPVVITTHGTELLWPRKLWWKSPLEIGFTLLFERFVLSHCDVVIAQSGGVKDYMLRIYGSGFRGRLRMIPTGVDHEKFIAIPKPPGPPQVLFVGALSEIKGVTCLLNAFILLHARIPQARLALVGSGPRAPEYKEYVKRRNLDGFVQFHGPIRDDIRLLSLYQSSDVVALPSNVGGPVSCTVLEGLSCGRAVISTDLPGGLHDVLAGGAGILIEPEDESKLAQEMERLFSDPQYLSNLEVRARSTIEEKYTLDRMIDSLTSLYRELAA